MESCIELPLSDELLKESVSQARDYALSHGLVLRTKENPDSDDKVIQAPITLLPSPVPKHCFIAARDTQTDFNLLMHRVAHDYEFLKNCLEKTIKVDDFTGRLWEIYETVRNEGISQPLSLGMNRSDYMFHCHGGHVTDPEEKVNVKDISIRQIEFNTIASSFGGLSTQITHYHRYILDFLGHSDLKNHLPDHDAADGLAEGMVTAWQQYNNSKAVILFLVTETERNVYDQRFLEFAVRKRNKKIKVVRASLQQLAKVGSLGENKQLLIDDKEVAIVYFRMAYTPSDFHGEKEWATRLLIERSCAIKCPNVYYHLAGTKKVQQVLAKPGVVEKFISDPLAVQRIRSTFAGQHSLDLGEEGDEAIAKAISNPQKYVLKPQREGGGNNSFGEDIPKVLKKLGNTEERNAYILMERIHPPSFKNYGLQAGFPAVYEDFVSELGIYGTVVGTANSVILNTQSGHLLRTKTVGTDEGGVATGFAAIDSPYLI